MVKRKRKCWLFDKVSMFSTQFHVGLSICIIFFVFSSSSASLWYARKWAHVKPAYRATWFWRHFRSHKFVAQAGCSDIYEIFGVIRIRISSIYVYVQNMDESVEINDFRDVRHWMTPSGFHNTNRAVTVIVYHYCDWRRKITGSVIKIK